MSKKIRPAVFARLGWYPASRSECERMIKEWSRNGVKIKSEEIKGVGGIVPHAGWFFSGEIACTVFRCISEIIEPETVVIFGKHLTVGSRKSIMLEGYWETPFGEIEIDSELAQKIAEGQDFLIESSTYFEEDNTIELQLPFVKYFFPSAKLVPIGAPPTEEMLYIAREIAHLCKDKRVIAIGSTDLTHYGPNYGFIPAGIGASALQWSKQNDKRVIDRMLKLDPEGVIEEAFENHNACCPGAAASAICMAKELGAVKGEMLMYATSYEKSPGSSFVGYVGVVF
ncbi:MAG: AmmeMemoRadiSam system protein B [Deltaproteobacteria bacterium]|nr:MAG: AmmeMemoRadiSam system protein B [Deltaproteobacteria bacterium]